MNMIGVIDGAGVYGSIYHYAFVIVFVASAFLIFLCLWKKNRLDMDEEPKYQMMQEEPINHEESGIYERKDK